MHTALSNKEKLNCWQNTSTMFPLSFKVSVGHGFLLLWIIMLQRDLPISTACLQDERSSLLDFKAGLSLSSGRSLSSWRGFNCCQWECVACDYHTSHVIRLDLSNRPYTHSQRFSGEISPSLFNLQHLQHLDLSGNDFKGISIPPELSKLHRLTFLSLSHAGFGGEVPRELGNVSSLRHLDISSRHSQRMLKISKFDVWVRNLRSLEFLRMDEMNLTMASEQWGEALGGLPNLTQIHLSECGLSGNIPELLNLTRLSHLNLSFNSFPFELPSWFENVSSLVSLDLRSCGLKGYIPSNFMPRSRLSNLVLGYNIDLKGNPSFILSHSSSLVELSLAGCNLEGLVLPRSIANFSKLKTIDLGHNELKGSIPSSFGNLSSLRYLDLSYNQLGGHIPPSLCRLPKLSELLLGHNQLSGTIPDSVSNLTSLQLLSLSSNGLTGNIPLQQFDNLTRLQVLDLSENQLFVNISTSWVPQFAHLKFLGLGSCSIEGDFPAFLSQQFLLERLDLSDNNIVGNLPLWLWDLPYLDNLILSNNQLEGSLPRQISPKFMEVDLHGNRLHGSLPALDFVSYILDLSDNEFNGSVPATIGTPSILSLSRNNLTGEIPSSICIDPNDLQLLDLSKNKLTGMIPANIGRCSYLSVLYLAENVLQGQIPEELGNLQSLRSLNLRGNRLQGFIPSSIANCTDLQVFDLGNNKFEGSIPVWIEKLTNLKILSLASNKFSDIIPPQLFKLQNLQILDLSANQLLGSIPPDVSKLYVMVNNSQSFDVQSYQFVFSDIFGVLHRFFFADKVTTWIKGREIPYSRIVGLLKFMDLSHNKLSGNIPSELGFLKGLISLNISKNHLRGSIPESLGAMVHLESLDLSKNKLSGKIPSQLLNLVFLSVLNLSNNMLSGLIPQGKQFATFEASSYLRNPHLYGPPLENRTLSSGLDRRLNNTTAEDADAVVMDRWWAVGVGLSYGVGFGIVISVLSFHIKWRYKCFALMDDLICPSEAS